MSGRIDGGVVCTELKPDKYVCSDCLTEPSLQQFVQQNATSKVCDYCARRAKRANAASVNSLLQTIYDGLSSEWTDPNGVLFYDQREGGWQGATVYDTDDLLRYTYTISENDDLLDDLASAIQHDWVELDSIAPTSLNAVQTLSWSLLSDYVKYENRYFFTQAAKEYNEELGRKWSPHAALKALEHVVSDLGLVKLVQTGTVLYRARVHTPEEVLISEQSLGPPTSQEARTGRMSPAGIPMFYCAGSVDTALGEARVDDLEHIATVGKWEVVQGFYVLDLYGLPDTPSIFDGPNRSKRSDLLFLNRFVADINKPIKLDGKEHIEYVPSQVVTEYVRLNVKSHTEQRILGIRYPSSRISEGENYALFLSQDGESRNSMLKLTDYLRLVESARYSPIHWAEC